jgi:hypothetical protein
MDEHHTLYHIKLAQMSYAELLEERKKVEDIIPRLAAAENTVSLDIYNRILETVKIAIAARQGMNSS